MLSIVWAVALAVILFLRTSSDSPWGRVLRSIREDEDAAAALGKNVFCVQAPVARARRRRRPSPGSSMPSSSRSSAPATSSRSLTFFAWTIVILGGTARIWAVPSAPCIFGVLFAGTRSSTSSRSRYFDSPERAYLRLVLIGLILIALMAFRPQGIFGRQQELVFE